VSIDQRLLLFDGHVTDVEYADKPAGFGVLGSGSNSPPGIVF